MQRCRGCTLPVDLSTSAKLGCLCTFVLRNPFTVSAMVSSMGSIDCGICWICRAVCWALHWLLVDRLDIFEQSQLVLHFTHVLGAKCCEFVLWVDLHVA